MTYLNCKILKLTNLFIAKVLREVEDVESETYQW